MCASSAARSRPTHPLQTSRSAVNVMGCDRPFAFTVNASDFDDMKSSCCLLLRQWLWSAGNPFVDEPPELLDRLRAVVDLESKDDVVVEPRAPVLLDDD